MRSAGEQKRDRTTNLHCSKLSPYSQTSNADSFHRSNSALRQTITLCKTWIRDQYPSYSILVELRADIGRKVINVKASERGTVGFWHWVSNRARLGNMRI